MSIFKQAFSKFLKPKYDDVKNATEFKTAGFLTLGAEIEMQLIDKETKRLIPKAQLFLDNTKNQKIKPEFYLSTLEANSGKCDNANQIFEDLSQTVAEIKTLADSNNVFLSTTGCHPISRYSDVEIYPSKRYNELIDRNQWIARRMTVYGLHIHLGLRSGDECINFMNFLLRYIPHLLSLSASSPFWQGNDTGLVSYRPTTYEALPTAGLPYGFNSWNDFRQLFKVLKLSGSINTINDIWWDIRPSPAFGTVEVRVCDGVATLSESAAIVALVHMLAHWFADNSEWLHSLPQPEKWILRENKWRAMRYGFDAQIVATTIGETKSLAQDITEWFDKLKPYSDKLGYGHHIEQLRTMVEKGNSAQRQRRVFEATGSLERVVDLNVAEFDAGRPIYDFV